MHGILDEGNLLSSSPGTAQNLQCGALKKSLVEAAVAWLLLYHFG